MTRLSATDAAVQVMLDEGVEIVFGIPGGAILPLYQSIWKSGKIRNYLVRHEQGGTHAADGYARATGKRILFYCAFGERSAMAVQAALDSGLDSARHIHGGIDAWKKAGGRLESSK